MALNRFSHCAIASPDMVIVLLAELIALGLDEIPGWKPC